MPDHCRRALITGANGFIGSRLARRWSAQGVEVFALVRGSDSNISSFIPKHRICAGLASADKMSALVQAIRPSTIVHLATTYDESQNLADFLWVNIGLGTALLEGAARCSNTPIFINTGSYWQFANGTSYSPNSLYAAAKQSMHDLLIHFVRNRSIRAVSLILYDTYGPNDPRSKLWNQVAHAQPGSRIQLSAGEQKIHLVHIEDVLRGIDHAVELLREGTELEPMYALRSQAAVPLRSLLTTFATLLDKDVSLDWGSLSYRQNQVFHAWDGPLLPGWSPRISLEQGVESFRAQTCDALCI